MMELRSTTVCACGHDSVTIFSAASLLRPYAFTGAMCAPWPSRLFAVSPPYTWSVETCTNRGFRVAGSSPVSPRLDGGNRSRKAISSCFGTFVAFAVSGSFSHAAGELIAAQFTTTSKPPERRTASMASPTPRPEATFATCPTHLSLTSGRGFEA